MKNTADYLAPRSCGGLTMPRDHLSIAGARSKRALLVLLVLLAILQQYPTVSVVAYGPIRTALYVGFGVLMLASLPRFRVHATPRLLRSASLVLLTTAGFGVVGGIGSDSFTPALEFAVAMGLVFVSWLNPLPDAYLRRSLDTIGAMVTGLSVALISQVGGFIVTDTYLIASKNQLGPMLGLASLASSWLLMTRLVDPRRKWLPILLSTINTVAPVLALLVVQNRAGMVGLALVFLIWTCFTGLRSPRTRVPLLLIPWLLALLVLATPAAVGNIASFVWDAFAANRDITDVDSLSSGRTTGYEEALNFIKSHPLSGQILSDVQPSQTPHNYVLDKWVRLGLLGSLPLIYFYVRLWVLGLRSQLAPAEFDRPLTLGSVGRMLIFSLVASLFEYSQPFGPGVSQILLWVLLGQILDPGTSSAQTRRVVTGSGTNHSQVGGRLWVR